MGSKYPVLKPSEIISTLMKFGFVVISQKGSHIKLRKDGDEAILKIIKKYGLPQNWNDDGKYGPERYIEAHIWSDETINKYRL